MQGPEIELGELTDVLGPGPKQILGPGLSTSTITDEDIVTPFGPVLVMHCH